MASRPLPGNSLRLVSDPPRGRVKVPDCIQMHPPSGTVDGEERSVGEGPWFIPHAARRAGG